MGNSAAKSAVELAADTRTSKWKTGSKTESIPIPFSTLNTFEKLAKSSDFKDWISQNLDSNHLVSSILLDSYDSEALLENVEYFRNLSPGARDELASQINNFELATVAGIDVSYYILNFKAVMFNAILIELAFIEPPVCL